MRLLLIALFTTNIYGAISNTGSGLGYSCSKEIGSIGKCSCEGASDCLLLGLSGLCRSKEGDVVLQCDLPPSQKCSCEWNQSLKDGTVTLDKLGFKLRASMDPIQ